MSRVPSRSLSAPPATKDTVQEVSEDTVQTFPLLTSETPQGIHPQEWMRDLMNSRSGRQSRASSIVSTRTRFSTTTLDEVRSIEINAGGHSFRISRDGSRIIDTTAPPPYPGSLLSLDQDEESEDHHSPSVATDHDEDHTIDSSSSSGPRKRVRIVMPGEDDSELETGTLHADRLSNSADQVLTKADLYQIMLDLPQQLKRVLGIRALGHNSDAMHRRDLVDNDISVSDDQFGGDLSSEGLGNGSPGTGKNKIPQEKPRSSRRDSDTAPGGLLYGLAGSQARDSHRTTDLQSSIHYGRTNSRSSVETLRPAENQDDELNVLMTVGDLNELSLLYNRVIRDLDREHRKQLHERDKDMAQLRSLLNEKDIVYRQQLKGKDFIIDDLKRQLAYQDEVLEKSLERARHEVEDTWEKRWKDRDRHLMERMKRMEVTDDQGGNAEAEKQDSQF